ncbi:MAG: 16S rRNA (uracil(1498)-N(3))-methyltransferase [Sneathiella sp.]|nr:16S rRNA (uracil(1498)-N(3))-methyltransferase [Sneathiella sp.]
MAQKQHSVRLFIDADLTKDGGVVLDKPQVHYVGTVMRQGVGDSLLLFNGRDGEWIGQIQEIKKNLALVHLTEQTRTQTAGPDIQLLFAPIKKTQNAIIIQKATELGVSQITPVQTLRTNSDKIRKDRMQLQVIEAAEQSERLSIPEISNPVKLNTALGQLDKDRILIFCHERLAEGKALSVLQNLTGHKKFAVLIGPEGGFSDEERIKILSCDQAHAISLGPRVLRAETAVISALSLLQAACGDWA